MSIINMMPMLSGGLKSAHGKTTANAQGNITVNALGFSPVMVAIVGVTTIYNDAPAAYIIGDGKANIIHAAIENIYEGDGSWAALMGDLNLYNDGFMIRARLNQQYYWASVGL